MSIEQTIAENTSAIIELTRVLLLGQHPVPEAPTVPPIIATAPTPAPTPAPVAVPVAPVAVPVAPVVAVAPFTDNKGLMAYCMSKYSSLGPVRGGEIQQILVGMGHQNLNSIPASQYAEFFTKVEAL